MNIFTFKAINKPYWVHYGPKKGVRGVKKFWATGKCFLGT